jgi:hypothetical protein
MSNLAKYALIGGCALVGGTDLRHAVIGLLYVKNSVQKKSFKPLEKQTILNILKQIRKESYPIYKRLVPLHHQISQQFKGISAEEFKQIIEGPGSPMNFKEKIDEITEKACAANGTTRKVDWQFSC